jgi:hypothetical protein
MALTRIREWVRTILRQQPSRRTVRVRLQVEYLEGRLTPANVSWTGAGDGVNWSDPRNWSTVTRVPGASDDVTIAPFSTVVIHASGTDTVHTLRSDTPVLLSGGSLSLTGSSLINNVLLITGGQLTNDGDLTTAYLNQSGGTVTGAGSLTPQYSWIWSGGTQTGNGHTIVPGIATMSGNATNTPNLSRIVDNYGTVTMLASSSLQFASDGVWNNFTDFILQGADTFTGAGEFDNLGRLVLNGTAGARSNVALNNSDTGGVAVMGGTFTLTTGSSIGTFQLVAGAVLTFDNAGTSGYLLDDGARVIDNGTLLVGSSTLLSTNGNVAIQNLSLTGGSMTIADQTTVTIANWTFAGGTVTGTGSLNVFTNFTWTGGTLSGGGSMALEQGTATLSGGASSVLDGWALSSSASVTVANDGIVLADNATFTNQFGHNLTLEGSTLAGAGQRPAVLFNEGTVTIHGNSAIGFDVNNFGSVMIAAGQSLSLAGSYTQQSGDITVAGGLTVGNTLTLQGGYLYGGGVISGDVVNYSELVLSGTPQSLTINGNYTQAPIGQLDLQINGPGPGTQYSQLIVNGTASLAGTLNILRQGSYVPTAGTMFQVVTFLAHSGDFQVYLNLDLGGGRFLTHRFAPDGMSLILQA